MDSSFGTNGFYTHTPSMWSDSRRRNVGNRDKDSFRGGISDRRNEEINKPKEDPFGISGFSNYTGKSKSSTTRAKNGPASESIEELPLISTEVLDAASQRRLAFVIFFIIQSYKLYDLILLKSGIPLSGIFLSNSRLNFISKYLVIDSLFFYCLPTFKIPKLKFKPLIVFLQIISSATLTLFISSEQSVPLVSLLLSLWRQYHSRDLSLTGDSVNPRKALNSAEHFKGAHTIKILPENTAYLNPFHSSFCLPLDQSGPAIELPIRVNSSSTINTVQLEFRDLYSNEVELWNFTKNDLKPLKTDISKEETDRNIHYFTVPLNKIGFYQLKTVLDTNNINLRIYKSQLVLPHCPLASINGKGENDRCVGDNDEVSIQVQGAPPLKLIYTKTINGQRYVLEDSSLQPEYFESPLLTNSKFYSQKDVQDLKWARSYPVDIALETSTKEYGEHVYSIEKIVDGFGNSIDFSTLSSQVREKYDLIHRFYVHDLPRVSLDEKVNPDSSVRRSLMVKLDSGDFNKDAPFIVQLSLEDNNSKVRYFEKQFNDKTLEFKVDEPGSYNLLSVKSRYCHGAVIGKSNVLISKPIPPQLSVKSTPILDQCVGQVGLNFDLTFTGVPPFYYKTKIYKTEQGERKLYDTKKFSSQGTRNQFTYSPTSEGSYEIVFTELSNELFTTPISLDTKEYTFKTSMRVKPSAKISGKLETKLCLGGKTKVPIKFSGEPPFTLNYDLVETSSNKRTSFNKENIQSYSYEIETPNFSIGGDHILSLVSVKDSSGCLVGLSGTDARITVRRDIPSASFAVSESSSQVSIKEASFAELPLKLSGEGPFRITYNHLNNKGDVLETEEVTFSSNYKPALKVMKEGLYKLASIRDQSCVGKIVDPNHTFQVNYLKKPTYSLIEHNRISKLDAFNYIKNDVCQGFEETIDLSLNGVPPFLIEYDMISPLGELISSSVQVATKYASIKFPNEVVGEYVIKIKNVYDSNYGKDDLQKLAYKPSQLSIRQNVNSLPEIEFLEKGSTYRTCSANIEQSKLLQDIKLKVPHGSAPFSVSFSIYHESSSKTDSFTMHNITAANFDYKRLYEGLSLGNHLVSIDSVADANGCINDLPSSDNQISISITDVPRISLADSTMEYCVGDYVGYQLSGTPPFIIKYDFNGKQLKSKERSSQFVRYASEPGVISIFSIQDSSSQCVVDFTNPKMKQDFERLSLNIHPIPSVTVSQGQEIVEDIHEGDKAEVIFSFEGTPPFALTYVRTENSGTKKGRKQQIVETHKVSDIYTYEYRVVTSLQGTYEALEVSDAFCAAKNRALLD
ncbi:Pom152 [Kluyveromyces lactis]|nr:Pom152 [Kluyveromyces lactis]